MINVRIQDERGALIEDFDDLEVVRALLQGEAKGTVCLQYIDPYGDTYFNQLQLSVLQAEIAGAAKRLPAELRLRAQNFAAFLRRAEAVHTYVRFVGD